MGTQDRLALFLTEHLIWFILAGMVVVAALFVPAFFTPIVLTNVFYSSAVLGMLVLAQAIVLMTGRFDLSIESTLAFAPMLAVLVMRDWFPGTHGLVGILVTLLVGAAVGYINGLFIVKVKIDPFLQTLAMLTILRGIVHYLAPRTIYGLPLDYTWVGKVYVGPVPFAVILLLAVYAVFHFVVTRRQFGRSLLSVGGNEQASFVSGVNTDSVVLRSFVISGILAAVAGLIMAGRTASIFSTMGQGMVFMAFAGAVLGGVSITGGVGAIPGALAGLLVLGVIDSALNLFQMSVYLIYATKGILIFIAILLDNGKIVVKQRLLLRRLERAVIHRPSASATGR